MKPSVYHPSGHVEDYHDGSTCRNSFRVRRSNRGSKVDAVLMETGPFLVQTASTSHRASKCTGPETGSPRHRLGPESLAGSSQKPPILLIGDPIEDRGWARLSTRQLPFICRLPNQRFSGTARCPYSINRKTIGWTRTSRGKKFSEERAAPGEDSGVDRYKADGYTASVIWKR
nr:unnamed protein product [Haemonchus contortus]